MSNTPPTRIGIVTGERTPALTEEGRTLAGILRRRGHAVEPLVWSEQGTESTDVDVLVFRSCWQYYERSDAFCEWLDDVSETGIRTLNPPEVVRWNLHKGYLEKLAAAGVSVPRTAVIDRGSGGDLRAVLERNDLERAVFKPAVGASSYAVTRCSVDEAADAQETFASLLAEGDVLVQRFVPAVESGELSLVFFAGEFSHAWLTIPAPDDFRAHHRFGSTLSPFEPSAAVVDRASEALDAASDACERAPSSLPFARVDGVRTPDGFELLELELIEPYLGLSLEDGAFERFADALEAAIVQSADANPSGVTGE